MIDQRLRSPWRSGHTPTELQLALDEAAHKFALLAQASRVAVEAVDVECIAAAGRALAAQMQLALAEKREPPSFLRGNFRRFVARRTLQPGQAN